MGLISILGDSISTYDGWSEPPHLVFYDAYHCRLAGLSSVKDTWWMRVIRHLGGQLGVNCSGAGTLITGVGPSAGCSERRTGCLDRNGVPDQILVSMGANDWAFGVPLGELDEPSGPRSFSGACHLMLHRLREHYPAADIVVATLPHAADPVEGPLFFNAESAGPTAPYNQILRAAAADTGCRIADLAAMDGAYSTIDGVHPDRNGMAQLSQWWLSCL